MVGLLKTSLMLMFFFSFLKIAEDICCGSVDGRVRLNFSLFMIEREPSCGAVRAEDDGIGDYFYRMWEGFWKLRECSEEGKVDLTDGVCVSAAETP